MLRQYIYASNCYHNSVKDYCCLYTFATWITHSSNLAACRTTSVYEKNMNKKKKKILVIHQNL